MTTLTLAQAQQILAGALAHSKAAGYKPMGVVVLDEAYVDFAPASSLPLLAGHDNLIVLRTFSKSFSLAGMRIGLAFASAEITAGMNKVRDSYNLDRLSIAAGAAALRAPGSSGIVRQLLCTHACRHAHARAHAYTVLLG